MKRLFIISIMLLPLLVMSQSQKPNWYDANSRKFLYPDEEYFVGFQSGIAKQNETLESAISRIKTEAQGDAAQRIQVHIKSETFDNMQSIQFQTTEGFDEEIHNLFQQQTYSTTAIDIPNLQVMTWNNPETREVAVLVYTKKRDFIKFYDRQIESLLSKMEVGLENALQQEQQGLHIKGRTTAEDALRINPMVEYAQRMVAIADVNITMNDLQMPRYTEVVSQLVNTINRLRHATAFYINCHAVINGKSYPQLDKEVRGLLAKKGCHFTDDQSKANWVIDIDADVINSTHKEGMAYFSYVDGTLSIQNGTTGKTLLEDRLSSLEDGHPDGIKGGDFNLDKATRIAYKDAARIISETIIKLIKE